MDLLIRLWARLRAALAPRPKMTPEQRDELADQWHQFRQTQQAEFESAYRADRGLRTPLE